MRWLLIILFIFSAPALSWGKVEHTHRYPTELVRIVDADTMVVVFDQGLGSYFKARVRIKDYDAPETWRPCNENEAIHGNAATFFAAKLIPENFTSVIYGWAAYNRVEITIMLPSGRVFSDVMKENGFEKRTSYDPDDDSC